MRRIGILLVFSFWAIATAPNADANPQPIRFVQQQAFQPGEHLSYKLHYGWITAGVASLKVQEHPEAKYGDNAYRIEASGRSIPAFDPFYRVRDVYESYIDKDALLPLTFIRDVDEGGFIINQFVKFDHHKQLAYSRTGFYKVPVGVQDIVSAFYYARSVDVSKMKKGDTFTISCFLDDEVFPMTIKFAGKETITTDAGKWRALKFVPGLLQGRVFKTEEDMIIYVSDDENKIPLMVQANILVGAVKMTLTDYKGLRNQPKARMR